MEGGKNGLGSGGERTAKACPSDDFLAGPAKLQSQTGCPREEKDPRKRLTQSTPFPKTRRDSRKRREVGQRRRGGRRRDPGDVGKSE